MLRHTTTPAERALALVIIARATADHTAALIANRSAAEPTELASAERVLTAALEYLHAVREVRTPRW